MATDNAYNVLAMAKDISYNKAKELIDRGVVFVDDKKGSVDFGLRYRSSKYDLYDFLALPCQNHYLEAYIFVFSRDRLWLTVLQSTPKIAGIFFCLKLSES